MAFIDPTQAVGDIVKMARTDPRHLSGIGDVLASDQDAAAGA
jgi:hypothetical protein